MFVFKLIDCVLQLLIQHAPVCNDDDGVENAIVGIVMEAGKLVRQPGDGIAFTAASRMLDEIVVAGAVGSSVGNEFADHVKLMVAGENKGLFFDCLPPDFDIFAFQMDEAPDDLQPTVFGPNLLP